MPELPEVEVMARALRGRCVGRVVAQVELLDSTLVDPLSPEVQGLEGAQITAVGRRGKVLLLWSGGPCISQRRVLCLHPRMTGVVRPLGATDPRPDRLRVRLVGGDGLRLVDPRRLARASLVPASDLALRFSGMGPEPWPGRREGAWWAARLGDARGPLKPAMLDQGRVAGIGNIAASEILFEAGLHPSTPARALLAADWEGLATAAVRVLDRTVRREEATGLQLMHLGGPNPFEVVGRAGRPCPRCGGPITRGVMAGRGTWWCLACQPEPGGQGSGAPVRSPR